MLEKMFIVLAPRHRVEIEGTTPLSFGDRRITLDMAAMFSKWLPKWWMQWHDVFGNTFYEIYAPQNRHIVKIETLRPLVSEIGLFLEMSAILLKWPPKWRTQWHDVFGNTFSEIYAPENLYIIESTMMALRLLVSEIWWNSGHFFKWPPKPPRGKSGLAL